MKNIPCLQLFISLTILTLSGPIMAQSKHQKSAAPTTKIIQERGVIGGGGGLEDVDSYIKRIDEIKGYGRVVAPVLEQIKHKLPNYYARLNRTMKFSGFYVAPIRVLNKLPASIQGIPFDITDLEQAAYNINNEAWFVEHLMKKKTEDDAGNLLLHEVFMLDIVSLIPKEKLAPTNPNYRQEWALIHSTVRRMGGYFRKYSMDSDAEFAEAIVNFYGPYYPGILGSEIVKTRTEIDSTKARESVIEADRLALFNYYMPQFKLDATPYCEALPRLDVFEFLKEVQFSEALAKAGDFANFIFQRYIVLTKSGQFTKTEGQFKAVQEIIRLTTPSSYSQSVQVNYADYFSSQYRQEHEKRRAYERIFQICINLQNLPSVERK